MLSRIRLDAEGVTADEVERTLYPHADEIERMLGVKVKRGECVIERQEDVPEGEAQAWHGRLALYPDVATPLGDSSDEPVTDVLRRLEQPA